MLKIKSKKMMSLLLAGVTVITGSYYYMSNSNSSEKKDMDKDSSSKNIDSVFCNYGVVDSVTFHDFPHLYDEKVSYYMLENDESIIQNLDDNKIDTGALIKNIDSDTEELIGNTLFKITDENKLLVCYVKFEDNPLIVKLKPGTYYLSEVCNNMSYLENDENITFEVSQGHISDVLFKNKKSKSGVIIYNIDNETGENVKKLYVSIIDQNDNIINYITYYEPYRLILAPGKYNIIVEDLFGEYNYQQLYSSFDVKEDEFKEIEFKIEKKNNKIKIK